VVTKLLISLNELLGENKHSPDSYYNAGMPGYAPAPVAWHGLAFCLTCGSSSHTGGSKLL